MSAKVLSLIPPMTQLNTPYPSTAYLTGFLRSRRVHAVQEDLALGLVLRFFTREGLQEIHEQALGIPEEYRSASVNYFLDYFGDYRRTIAPVIAFLQGRDSTLSHRINTRDFLSEGPRFSALDAFDVDEGSDSLSWAFGALGSYDRARHLATLYLNDLSDVLRDAVDERFEFVRYAESLASSQPTFTPLADALPAEPTLVDLHLQALTKNSIERHQPTLVLLSVPFPGAMYAALKIAQVVKKDYPNIKIAMGGGYVNTELRELSDPRIFDYVDFITLDSGERPLLALLEHLDGKRSIERLVRTFVRNSNNQVQYLKWQEPDIPFEEVGTATWDGLLLVTDAGILVHAYLMYGFPTQAVQETVDALEYVRQLFENGCIQSGFFHRFICTVHSPVGFNPDAYGIKLIPLPETTFAKNDISFFDPTGVDHDGLGLGLKKAIYNYMHGVGFDIDADSWFDGLGGPIPKTTVPRNFIENVLYR